MMRCPHCQGTGQADLLEALERNLAAQGQIVADLRALLGEPSAPPPTLPSPEEWLEPCVLAARVGISEGYCRDLIRRGLKKELPGFKKPNGRLYATPDAVSAIRP